ncbi:MAG: AsmA family protein [Bryobacterales bacterium]|nr:AsmA family protein [Bryobacterales bacterium]
MKRRLLLAALVLAGAWYAARPLLRAERFRHDLHAALERSLDRKVDITGLITYSLWNGPGFSLANVVIHEDPGIGIEPFAYVTQLDATVRILPLLTGRLEVSRIVLDEPRVNLVKTDAGAWNVRQFLVKGTQGGAPRSFPEIQVRAGRINLKLGDTKSVLYLSNADLDVTPGAADRIDLQFRVEPARTDRPAQGIGTLTGYGRYRWYSNKPGDLELDLDLQRSAISDLVSLLEGRGAGMRGFLASRATIKGPLDKLALEGSLGLEDIQRWDLLRLAGGKAPVRYKGTLDFQTGSFDLDARAEGKPAPFTLRIKGQDIFAGARWGSLLEFKELPVASLRDLLAYVNIATPERIAIDGKVNGVVSYSPAQGLQGLLETPEATVKNGDAVVTLREARVAVEDNRFRLLPSKLTWGDGQNAEVFGHYEPSGYLLAWESRQFLPIDDFLATQARFVGGEFPLLAKFDQGQWMGKLQFSSNSERNAWTGAFTVRDARLSIPGVASPVVLKSAGVSVLQNNVVIDNVVATAGTLAFRASKRGPQWNVDAPAVDLVELERLFLPTLKRSTGFLRTITRRAPPVPDWLRERKLSAYVNIHELTAGGVPLGECKGLLTWTGATVELAAGWDRDQANAGGKITLRLAGAEPVYSAKGTITRLPWKGSEIEGEIQVQSSGTGLTLLRNAKATGTFEAKALPLTPEDFRTASGAYELSAPRGVPVLKLSSIETTGGPEPFTGQGGTDAEGKLSVELTSARKKMRLAGTLWPFNLEPVAR